MTFKQISIALYATYLTNKYGFKLKNIKDRFLVRDIRLDYAKVLLSKLNIKVTIINQDKVPKEGQYLVTSNHRSIIDPLVVELALEGTQITGCWIAKKELYNSFFFGTFVRNAGTILLDREAKSLGSFFKNIKEKVKKEESIFIFPEGTRNQTNEDLAEFKEGSAIIALKNRLPILPFYIRTNATEILKDAIENRTEALEVIIEVGDIIDYKDRTLLEDNYKKQFNLK